MKYFVFADVHGYYSLLMKELENKGFDINNKDHMLISIGDNFDRGPENFKMYEFLKSMKEQNRIILVKGNHEDLFLKMLYKRSVTFIDISNGTYETLLEFISHYYEGEDPERVYQYHQAMVYGKLKDEGILDFMYDMLDYYETDKYIFTHGFIPIDKQTLRYKEGWRESTSAEFESSRWLNGIEMSMYYNIGEKDKKIVVGHFHTSYGNVRKGNKGKSYSEYKSLEFEDKNNFGIYEDDNIIAIDACTHYTKKINVLVLDE